MAKYTKPALEIIPPAVTGVIPPVAPVAQPAQPRIPRQRTQEEMLTLLHRIMEVAPQMRHFRDDDNPVEVMEDIISELLRGRELIESEKNNVMLRAAELGRRF